MNDEPLRPFQDLLTRISEIPNGGLDAWIYFLASGLVFAFLERRTEAAESMLARVQAELNAKESPDVSFEDNEIIEIAIKTFHGVETLKLPSNAVEMILFNTIQVAKAFLESCGTPIDVSWTCFKLGWDHRYFLKVDHLELRDSETGELVMEYRPRAGAGETGVEGKT
jgi:hypothetical protein